MGLWEIEDSLYAKGCSAVCGIDEAGRGPLAGPVCAAACILPQDLQIEGLNDSKKLSAKKREALYDIITKQAIAWAVCLIDEARIDEINILQATFEAMRGAVGKLSVLPDYCLVDGNRDPGLGLPTLTVVKGDAKCATVAAASILAKVTRDRLMVEYDGQYPGYGFAVHKGYGTKAHYAAIDKLGLCPIHRRTFLKSYGNR
ncbi:MAG: ribonuclease HII [Oscillospiraceae bacterium]|nr:ribonuclease HII [Oscillospiraceae bacterium]MBQ6280972.1 ribonuclease HII [Oscillospiraceae bacterium]MBQ9373429.1 ribonuclease HII [Oscillospiraceae bacterium]